MINKNYQTVIGILNSFLYNKKITVGEDLDWNEVSRIININSVSGIAGYVFENLSEGEVPQNIQEKCSEDFFSTVSISTMRDEAMKLLLEQLDQQKIDRLLFKGYEVKNLYTVPELRTFGDIDFAIHRKDRERCNRLMLQNGFQLHNDWEPVYSYEKSYEYYEIHTQLMDSDMDGRAAFQNYFRDFWKYSEKIGEYTYVLYPGFHLFYLLTHIAKHLYGSGAGIRMYLDIAFFVRAYREKIDWGWFQREVTGLHLEKFVNTVFAAIDKWFDVKSPFPLQAVNSDFMERFIEFTLNGGVFGYINKDSAEVELRKELKGKKVRRTSTFFHLAFPSANTLEVRYTYLQGRHWLLPAAWIHRLFKKKQSTVYYLKESKGIFTADSEKLRQMQELYDQIGL